MQNFKIVNNININQIVKYQFLKSEKVFGFESRWVNFKLRKQINRMNVYKAYFIYIVLYNYLQIMDYEQKQKTIQKRNVS